MHEVNCNNNNAQLLAYTIFNTNLLHNIFINYCYDIFWPQFLATFMEHINFLICAAYMSIYLVEILQ
jgi:hypothetical protein